MIMPPVWVAGSAGVVGQWIRRRSLQFAARPDNIHVNSSWISDD